MITLEYGREALVDFNGCRDFCVYWVPEGTYEETGNDAYLLEPGWYYDDAEYNRVRLGPQPTTYRLKS